MCPDDATLAAFAEGRTSGSTEHDGIVAHLATCSTCPAVVAGLGRALVPSETLAQTLPAIPVAENLEPGARLGQYLVTRSLGRGAMGSVSAAWDATLEREVALKVLHGEPRGDAVLVEARALARLNHPNVVQVFEVASWHGRAVLVMERVHGVSLREWFTASRRTPDEVIAIFTQCARGLAAAHDAGVVHRDIKPDNIVVDADGRARLIDFGLAATGSASGFAGTPAYLAPQQLDGQPADALSDQFAWWVSLHEALTGERPFAAPTLDGLKAAVRAEPKGLERLPPWLRTLMRRGLSVEPASRFASMHEVAQVLERGPWRRRLVPLALAGLVLAGATTWGITSALPGDPCARLEIPSTPEGPLRDVARRLEQQRSACSAADNEERIARAGCLTAAANELSIAIAAIDRAGDDARLAPRTLRRVTPPEHCGRQPTPRLVAPPPAEREALVESQLAMLAVDAAREASELERQVSRARAMRERAERSGSATALAWGLLIESSALTAKGEVDAALKSVQRISHLAGVSLRERAWAATYEAGLACALLAPCGDASRRAAQLVAELDEPWLNATWLELRVTFHESTLEQAQAAWATIPGAEFERTRAVTSALIATNIEDLPQLRTRLALARGVASPSPTLRVYIARAEGLLGAVELDAGALSRAIGALDELRDVAFAANVRFELEIALLQLEGRLEEADAQLVAGFSRSTELAMRYWMLTERGRIALVRGDAERWRQVDEMLSLVATRTPAGFENSVRMLRARAALMRGDAAAMRNYFPDWETDVLLAWRLARLEGRTDDAKALVAAAAFKADTYNQVLALAPLVDAGRWDDVAKGAERVVAEAISMDELGEARTLLINARFGQGRVNESCALLPGVSGVWLSPPELARLEPVRRACAGKR